MLRNDWSPLLMKLYKTIQKYFLSYRKFFLFGLKGNHEMSKINNVNIGSVEACFLDLFSDRYTWRILISSGQKSNCLSDMLGWKDISKSFFFNVYLFSK